MQNQGKLCVRGYKYRNAVVLEKEDVVNAKDDEFEEVTLYIPYQKIIDWSFILKETTDY